LLGKSTERKKSKINKAEQLERGGYILYRAKTSSSSLFCSVEIFDDGRHALKEVKRSNLMTFSNRIISRCCKSYWPLSILGRKGQKINMPASD